MNERIEELAHNASMLTDCWDVPDRYTEKLAELIIQECMSCVTWVGEVNTNPIEPIHTTHAINKRIEKYFGVEE